LKNDGKKKDARNRQSLVRRILIAYEGAEGANPSVKRSRDEARKLAVDLAKKLRKPNANFAEFAKKHSDAPDAARGGLMPPIKPNAKLGPQLKAAAFRTPVGKTSGVMSSKQGFLIVHRVK